MNKTNINIKSPPEPMIQILQKLIDWFKEFGHQKHIENEEHSINRAIHFCNICSDELHFSNSFKCKYCGKFHCDEHRLPEDHNCKDYSKPSGMTGGTVSYSKGKTSFIN